MISSLGLKSSLVNIIYESSFMKIIKKNIDQEIKVLDKDLIQNFQLVQVLLLPVPVFTAASV